MTVELQRAVRVLRSLLVVLCVAGASWGFSAGSHATSHAIVGAATPGHHHAPSGHGGPMVDDSTAQVRRRRSVAITVVAGSRLPRARALWVALRSAVAAWRAAVPSPRDVVDEALAPLTPERLCVFRT